MVSKKETPDIDWLIDQITTLHSPLIDFNVKRLKKAIKEFALDQRKEELHGIGNAAVDAENVEIMDYVDYRLKIINKERG